jgi:uridine phosphorylase
VYQEFDQAAVRALLGIDEADDPAGLILHGTYDMPTHADRWRDRLANARVATRAFNIVIGEVDDVILWYTPVLGAPMAAMAAHCAAVLGARSIVQIGSFGCTRRGMEVADLLLVTGAGRGEAASDWYLPKGAPAEADARLCEYLRQCMTERGLSWHEGRVYTTAAHMAGRWEDILRWEEEGYAGVEMEAATTLSVASCFDVPAACLIYLLDNLIEEHHRLCSDDEDRERVHTARDIVEAIALQTVAAMAAQP